MRDPDSGAVWVRRTVRHLAVDQWRHLRIRRRHAALQVPRSVPGPDEDLVVLVAALRQVPVRQREVLVLHYVADRSVAEIAAALDIEAEEAGNAR